MQFSYKTVFFLEKPQDELTLDEMLLNSKWISSKAKAEKGYHLSVPTVEVPKSTWEENSDMVGYIQKATCHYLALW